MIERDDYAENPPKGYFRLTPGAEVRLRYGYIVKCTGATKDAAGVVTEVHCTYDPATRSGTPGADARKVKGNIHWLSAPHAVPAEVRDHDRLFKVPFPGARNPWGTRSEAASAGPASARGGVAGDDDEGVDVGERTYLDDLNPTPSACSRPTSSRRLPGRRAKSASSSSATAHRRRSRGPMRRGPCSMRGDAQGFLEQALTLTLSPRGGRGARHASSDG